MASSTPFCTFTERLPAEIRNQMYEDVLTFESSIGEQDDGLVDDVPPADVALLFVNKQIYSEALPIFLQKNKFSLLYSHVCPKRICTSNHACSCGHTIWPSTSLAQPRLNNVEQLEIRISNRTKEWAICTECSKSDATCYQGLSQLLEDIVLLPKLRTFTILCKDLQDFIRGHNGLRCFLRKTVRSVAVKIVSTQIGRNEVTVGGKRIVLQCPKFTSGWMSAHMQALESTGTYVFHPVETRYRIDSLLSHLRDQANFGRETPASLLRYFEMDENDGINKLQLKARPNAAVTLAAFNMTLAVVIRRFQRAHYEIIQHAELDPLMMQPTGERWDFTQGFQGQKGEEKTAQELSEKYPDSDEDNSDGDDDDDDDNDEDGNEDDSDDVEMDVDSSDGEEDPADAVET